MFDSASCGFVLASSLLTDIESSEASAGVRCEI
jgi:hypothetical protein